MNLYEIAKVIVDVTEFIVFMLFSTLLTFASSAFPATFQIRNLQPSPGEHEQKEASGCTAGAELRCVCRATPGSSFAAEVARRVARRALERRTLCRAHHWEFTPLHSLNVKYLRDSL